MATICEGLRGRSLSYLSLLLKRSPAPLFPSSYSLRVQAVNKKQDRIDCSRHDTSLIDDIRIYDIHLYTNLAMLIVNRESEQISSPPSPSSQSNSFSDSLCESLSSLVNPKDTLPLTAGFKGKPKSAIQGERNVGCKESGR
jgi:hypothetical protein